jgi:hypothetical protein
MRFLLGALVVLFNVADNTTTFLCLREPVAGFEVFEANPIARWLFDSIGLVEGLVLEMAITTAAIAFLVFTRRIPGRMRLLLLFVLAVLPAWAALNNLLVIRTVGLSLGA